MKKILLGLTAITYEASKAQLATSTTEQQTASCKQAQEMLEQVKKLQADAAKKAEAAAKK